MISKIAVNYNPIKYGSFTSKKVKQPDYMKKNNYAASKTVHNYCSNITFGHLVGMPTDNELKALALQTLAEENIKFNNNTIRPPEELSAKDVVRIIDDQLDLITATQIDDTILASFKETDRPLALKALQYMCQFANMNSLNNLAGVIGKLKLNPILTEYGGASLASNLYYLKEKNNFEDLKVQSIGSFEKLYTEFRCSLLLDKNLLERLKTNPALLEHIKECKNLNLVYPESWINGVNPFNQVSLDKIIEKVNDVVIKAKVIKEEKQCSNNEAIIEALNQPIIEDMEKLGLKDRLIIINSRDTKENPDAMDIEKLLVPTRIGEDTLKNIIETKIPEGYRQAVLEMLAREARIFTPRTLSKISQQQHQDILALAQTKGINKDDIYYYIPENFKSYGMTTMIYQLTNDIPSEKIITESDFFNKFPDKAKCMLVVLDDFAGSGKSLGKVIESIILNLEYKELEQSTQDPTNTLQQLHQALTDSKKKDISGIKKHNHTVQLVLSPMISTEKAESNIIKNINAPKTAGDNGTDLQTNVNYCPGLTIKSLTSSDFYTKLDQNDQKLFDKILYNKGYDDNGVCVAFPYMGPDNNNLLFADLIAPHFTLNQKGVKNQGGWKRVNTVNIADKQQQFKDLIESCQGELKPIIDSNNLKKVLELEGAQYTAEQLSNDLKMYIDLASQVDPQYEDLSKLTDFTLYHQQLMDSINGFDRSIKELSQFVDNPENCSLNSVEEMYDRWFNLKHALRDCVYSLSHLYYNFVDEDSDLKATRREIRLMDIGLDREIRFLKNNGLTGLRDQKGPEYAQKEEAYIEYLTRLKQKTGLLHKRYNEILEMTLETHNKLIPFLNKTLETMNKTFSFPQKEFFELKKESLELPAVPATDEKPFKP